MTSPLIPTPAPKSPHVQAAWINAIREEGTKNEACHHLQATWNDLCAARSELAALRKAAAPATPAPATITRHDWFAGQALAGICAGHFANEAMTGMPPSAIADFARECADAMVEALK